MLPVLPSHQRRKLAARSLAHRTNTVHRPYKRLGIEMGEELRVAALDR